MAAQQQQIGTAQEVSYWPEVSCIACGGATREAIKRAGREVRGGYEHQLWQLECGHVDGPVVQEVTSQRKAEVFFPA